MGIKTRYLQLSDTTMMEYCLHENEAEANDFAFLYTKLKNGHYAMFSPASYEAKQSDSSVVKLPSDEVRSVNTLFHLAVPTDAEDSNWYSFIDPDYKYATASVLNELDPAQVAVNEYSAYCSTPGTDLTSDPFYYKKVTSDKNPGWDRVRLYFTSGYDFSDIYSGLLRISVQRNDEAYLDLCNFMYMRSNVYKYITYMASPIIFGNFIYDKYLEIALPSIDGLSNMFNDIFNIKTGSTLKLMFAYVSNDNKTLSNIEYSVSDLFNTPHKTTLTNVNCSFSRTSFIKGAIPVNKLNSDNLGVYLAEDADRPYIEFCGTWKDEPLSTQIVQRFNVDIQLYDQSLVRKNSVYEVDENYTPEYNLKKWVAMHEIKATVVDTDDNILKSETYSMSQVFIGGDEQTKFYYRPVILDDKVIADIIESNVALIINYTLRLMNIEDSVQFTKSGSLSLSGNSLYKFVGSSTTLKFSERMPYKVYNKIIENKQEIVGSAVASPSVKYVKTFYNSTDVVLDSNSNTYENTGYTLVISPAPKTYKFVFKIKDINGNYKFMDLTDTYYKLYGKDNGDNDIVIEPTYSSNMNMLLGELEFALTASTIAKLKAVAADKRKLSIVAYNTDNSVSSMYDFSYTF